MNNQKILQLLNRVRESNSWCSKSHEYWEFSEWNKYFDKFFQTDNKLLKVLVNSRHVNQWKVFNFLANHPEANAKEISQQLNILPGTLSKCIHKLIQHNLVNERVNEVSHREKFYTLTPKGQHYIDEINNYQQSSENRDLEIIDTFSQSEKNTIYKFLLAIQNSQQY